MKLSASKFERIINSVVAQPYIDGGRGTLERPGFDCLGLVFYIYTALGIDMSWASSDILNGFYNLNNKATVNELCFQQFKNTPFKVYSKDLKVLKKLDILGMVKEDKAHAGIVLPGYRFIHATSNSLEPARVVIRDLNHYKRLASYFLRYEGIEWIE